MAPDNLEGSMSEEFDFASIDGHIEAQEAGKAVAITLPGGKATGLMILVAGPDSDRVKNAIRWGRDRSSSTETLSDEAREDIQRETTARCCVGWSGARYNGKETPFSIEEAVRWFKKWPFAQRQVSDATGDVVRFMKA
jgi:hypothetical protein